MRDLPRKLTVAALARLFEGRTRLVERLAAREDPLGDSEALLREIPEPEWMEALDAHPRIGSRRLSTASAREQGSSDDPAVEAELARLNALYEERFGFRFVVFVNRRSRAEILRVLRHRLGRTRGEELQAAAADLVAIARDRYRIMKAGKGPVND
jgi:2-oxo-4-hydroxy-4-carboxy--5-ureidoimidazoline (OHCU) decarboxylase